MTDAEKIKEWRIAMSAATATLNRWLAHQYSDQEQFVVVREARDKLRAALEN